MKATVIIVYDFILFYVAITIYVYVRNEVKTFKLSSKELFDFREHAYNPRKTDSFGSI